MSARPVLLLITLLLAGAAHAQDGQAERAPFTDIRFLDEGRAEIRVAGQWCRWIDLDGIAYDEIRRTAMRLEKNRWQKRVAEDLVWVLSRIGHEPGPRVDLTVEAHGETVTLRDIPMTRDKRDVVRDLRHARARRDELDELDPVAVEPIDPVRVFDELIELVEDRHAYAHLRELDLRAEARRELDRLGARPPRDQLVLAVQRFVCRLGDGHAKVQDWLGFAPRGRSPILLEDVEGGIVAFRPDRVDFIDRDHPFIVAIDGVAIEQWIDAASAYVTAGSEQLVRRRAIQLLRYMNLVRDELGLERSDTIDLGLRDGSDGRRRIEVPVVSRRGLYGGWPRSRSRMLDDGIGYLRLPTMQLDDEQLARFDAELKQMLDARALIIDVRGNSGGGRQALRTMLPHFLRRPGHASRVVNVAAARVPRGARPKDPRGFLHDRDAYLANWDGWSASERRAIEQVAAGFRPDLDLEAGRFSDWHYMVVRPTRTPGASKARWWC